MKSYELTYLISSDLSEEEAKAHQKKTASFIQEEGGILESDLSLSSPTKRWLGYPIRNKRVAHLVASSFQLPPDKMEFLEKKIKADSQIIRFIITTKERPSKIKTRAPRKIILKPKTETPSPVSVEAQVSEKTESKKKKVELKEIEKKLDEILSE